MHLKYKAMKNSIYIPEPCHENWDKMSPSKKGRFCQSCTKEVVDFTRMSSEQIVETLHSASGRTCGHFLSSQVSSVNDHGSISSNFWMKIRSIAATLLAFIGFFGTGKNATAQREYREEMDGMVFTFLDLKNTINHQMILKGKITLNGSDSPISKAKVQVFSAGEVVQTTQSDKKGNYRMVFPGGTIEKYIKVVVSTDHFKTKILDSLTITKQKITLDVQMNRISYSLGMVARVVNDDDEYDNLVQKQAPEKTQENKADTISIAEQTAGKLIVVDSPKEVLNLERDSTNDPIAKKEERVSISTDAVNIMENENGVKLFPSPTKDNVTIELELHGQYHIEIFDNSGRRMSTLSFNGRRKTIDVSTFPKGIYHVRISSGSTAFRETMKLIKN